MLQLNFVKFGRGFSMKKLSILAATVALSLTLATVASADTSSTSNTGQSNTSIEATTTQTTTTDTTSKEAPSAETENAPVRLTVSEPFVKGSDLVVAPLPIELNEITVIYEAPEGKAWSKLAPQTVTPSGKVQGEWFEIHTWLGDAWVHLPGYTLRFN